MKKIWGLGTLFVSCGVALAQFACSAAPQPAVESTNGDHKFDDLIGSVPVNSKSLDGIGSIGLVYEYGGYGGSGSGGSPWGTAGSASGGFATATAGYATADFGDKGPSPIIAGSPGIGGAASAGSGSGGGSSFYPQCTGTLISKNSVLTSRSCAQLFEQANYGYWSLKFAIGADATQPSRLVDVVDVEYAPLASAGGSGYYPDIAVLHLAESITDVATFPVALLTDDLIGKPFAGVGFGYSDLRYQSGTRRAGSLTLGGTSGLLYPLIFGSFDAFYAFALGGGYYPAPYPGYGGYGGYLAEASAGAPSPGIAGSTSGGAFPTAGFGGSGPRAGSGGASAGTGGGNEDWYRQYLQQQYDSAQLAPGEAYLGGTDSDAQPCGADQGGPIVRKLSGKVRVFGVFSRTPFGNCEKGGLYATINSETKAFVDAAAQWKDPCTDLTSNGKCVGTTATRCSSTTEGKRRAVKFDCSLLNQVCVGGGNTEVTCTDK